MAAEWMGWQNVFNCEINPFCRQVLSYYWPEAKSYTDIKNTDFTSYADQIDILSGGFPCQPYSTAGKRKGTADDRHLWPYMLRAIREIAPRFVVGENVSGLISWSAGMVFNQVQIDLENEGYEVQSVVLPACSVNAPHRRDRVWFVAANTNRKHRRKRTNRQNRQKTGNSSKFTSNTSSNRRERKGQAIEIKKGLQQEPKPARQLARRFERPCFSKFPTQPPVCGGNDGVSAQLDGITFSKWRQESIKAYGNAIVPQVAFQIFTAINNSICA